MDRPHRKHTRWPGFDYRLPGPYHVVACTEGRLNRFADICNDMRTMHPSGAMVEHVWKSGPERFPAIRLDAFVIMPNHVHLVFWFEPTDSEQSPTVGDVMKWFKSETTVLFGRGVRELGWPAYEGRLWQRNYYDHVIRTAQELDAVRRYIENNPHQWTQDSLFHG